MYKHLLVCHSCERKYGRRCNYGELVPLSDTDIYQYVCPDGSRTVKTIQNPRFEILTELALLKFNNSIFENSVTRFSSALERFFEFLTVYYLRLEGFDDLETTKILKKIKLSERLRGSFELVTSLMKLKNNYLFPETPDLDNLSQLRNKVVHGGYLPTVSESRQHGTAISEFLATTVQWMKDNHHKETIQAVDYYARQSREKAKRYYGENETIWTGPVSTAIYTPKNSQTISLEFDTLRSEAANHQRQYAQTLNTLEEKRHSGN